MSVYITHLDDDKHVTTLPQGSHVLGRGPTLNCTDKRVSRNHAVIQISGNNVTLTSTHVNPCFLKGAASKTLTILQQNISTELKDGDAFGLLPDDFWFRIKLDKGDTQIETNNSSIPESIQNGAPNESDFDKPENNQEPGPSIENNLEISQSGIVEEGPSTENDQTCLSNDAPDIVPSDDNPEAGPSSSNNLNEAASQSKKVKREKCWYGDKCYRKNKAHRDEYKHPGDSDFESDPDDDQRPSCPYGAKCYRKNKDHIREFKHPQKRRTIRKSPKTNGANITSSDDSIVTFEEFDDSDADPDFKTSQWSESEEEWAETGDDSQESEISPQKKRKKKNTESGDDSFDS